MLSHANLLGNVADVADVLGMTPEDRLCIPVPFFYCFGSVLGTLLCVVGGTTMLPLAQFRPAEVLRTVQARCCKLLHGVPAMFIAELEEFRKGEYDTSSLKSGIMGGSPCPLEVMRAVTSIRLPTRLYLPVCRENSAAAAIMSCRAITGCPRQPSGS